MAFAAHGVKADLRRSGLCALGQAADPSTESGPGLGFQGHEALAVDITCTDDTLTVVLSDGRVISAPLAWFPRLLEATPKQRQEWELIGGGVGIHRKGTGHL